MTRAQFSYQSLYPSVQPSPPAINHDGSESDVFTSAPSSPSHVAPKTACTSSSFPSFLSHMPGGRRFLNTRMKRVRFHTDIRKLVIIIFFLLLLLLAVIIFFFHITHSNSSPLSEDMSSLSRHLTQLQSYLYKERRVNRARALWQDHVVFSNDGRILLPDTFESRFNAELAPFVSSTLERLWNSNQKLTCALSERVLIAFTLSTSKNIPASISFKRSCHDASTFNKCKHEHFVKDLRDVMIRMPSKSSRYSFAVYGAETNGNGNDLKIQPFGLLRGSFEVELSDAAQIGIQRYCGSSRRHFLSDLSRQKVNLQNTRTLSLYELKRLYRLLMMDKHTTVKNMSWEGLYMSKAVVDPMDFSRHSITWMDMVQFLMTRRKGDEMYEMVESKYDPPRKNKTLNAVSALQLDKEMVNLGVNRNMTNLNEYRKHLNTMQYTQERGRYVRPNGYTQNRHQPTFSFNNGYPPAMKSNSF